MAASFAAVKKDLRKKMKNILKDLPDTAAASQSRNNPCAPALRKLTLGSGECDQDAAFDARIQGRTQNQRLPLHA
jgi:hypothetical protein